MKYIYFAFLITFIGCSSGKPHKNWNKDWNKVDELKFLPIAINNYSVIDTTVDLSNAPSIEDSLKPTIEPELLQPVPPLYPEDLRRGGIQGEVWLNVLISPGGKVVKANVFKSDNEGFNYFCLHAIIQWKFSPPLYNGFPGFYWKKMPMKFRIN